MVDASGTEILCVFFAAVLIRSCVSLHGYSGEGVPPMYGDFEAQRHWMEVSVNLPPRTWYEHGPDNDLQYWGLDYPPLSAYLSWIIGLVACWCGHPELVALHDSRGHESEQHVESCLSVAPQLATLPPGAGTSGSAWRSALWRSWPYRSDPNGRPRHGWPPRPTLRIPRRLHTRLYSEISSSSSRSPSRTPRAAGTSSCSAASATAATRRHLAPTRQGHGAAPTPTSTVARLRSTVKTPPWTVPELSSCAA